MNDLIRCLAGLLGFAVLSADASQLPETGESFKTLRPFDNLMRRFVSKNKIPGAALAVAKDGRLIYARGFGYADRERREPVQPASLFRIASISKPLTAVAIMQLVENGKLKLEDKVFSILTHKAHLATGTKIDPRLAEITIQQLLQHQGGWDRGRSFDPMFRPVKIANTLGVNPPAKADHIIRYMMGRKLDFSPDSQFAYSNFGYCLLGRVIEQVSGSDYEKYMRNEVLKPLGIHSMHIGKSLLKNRAKDEVRYYTRNNSTASAVMGKQIGKPVLRPYGAWYLEAMDSHGAWIASAVDLVRFGSAVEYFDSSKVLTKKSIGKMVARPKGIAGHDKTGKPKATYYGFGWAIRPVRNTGKFNRWHSGGLDGTSTILVLRHDGLCWAALFNTNQTPDKKRPGKKIDPLIHKAADAVKAWPKHDLFQSQK
jgi:N-acyl-D-amino-acid deacylase